MTFAIKFGIFGMLISTCAPWLAAFLTCCLRKCLDEQGKYGSTPRIPPIPGIPDIPWSPGGIPPGKPGIINAAARGRVWVPEVFETVAAVCVSVEFVGPVPVWVELELIVVVLLGVVEERVGMVPSAKVLLPPGTFA